MARLIRRKADHCNSGFAIDRTPCRGAHAMPGETTQSDAQRRAQITEEQQKRQQQAEVEEAARREVAELLMQRARQRGYERKL
jgi:hypothetical protein